MMFKCKLSLRKLLSNINSIKNKQNRLFNVKKKSFNRLKRGV